MQEELTKIGFAKNEAKIYLELLKNKDLTAGEISKNTSINRRTTYDTLTRLVEKGYVGYNISANRQIFHAVNPEVILKNINSIRETASKLIPKLKVLSKEKDESKVIVYRGRKGIRNILNLILECKEYVSFGTTDQFPKIMQHDYQYFQNRKEKLKIKTRTILSEKLKNHPILKTAYNTKFKFLSEKLTSPTSTFIFNNKVAIFIWQEPLYGILIESKEIYGSYKEYFEELWKIAK